MNDLASFNLSSRSEVIYPFLYADYSNAKLYLKLTNLSLIPLLWLVRTKTLMEETFIALCGIVSHLVKIRYKVRSHLLLLDKIV